MQNRQNWGGMTSLTKTAGYYTAVDFSTKAMQAASLLFLANIFSKPEFGSFSILYAVVQLLSAIVVGGSVEFATALLARNNSAIDAVLKKTFLVVAARLTYLAPLAFVVFMFLHLIEFDVNFHPGYVWWATCFVAGIANGVVNVYIGILTCHGLHRKSIVFRAKVIVTQSTIGLACAWLFNEIDYYLVALALIPIAAGYKPLLNIIPELTIKLRPYTNEAFSYFFINSIINWIPWYGLTLAVGLLLNKGAAADYALVMNIASVMLLAAGGVSQAFISIQISKNGFVPESTRRKVIVLQATLLAACAAILYAAYELMLRMGAIGHNYSDLHLKLAVSLLSIIVSAAYFITVPLYSLQRRGLVLVYISISATTLAAVAGAICYYLAPEYFPYATFCTFFASRAWLVSANSKCA